MLPSLFVIVFLVLPSYVHSSCCRLPFTDGECRVNRQGPHRYQIMPDRKSGIVMESTECSINDFNSTYRKVVETKNYCNDCPGLLILHTNSSEIFLFPEYLERILEGRTTIQRKNVVILTASLVGAYDLDFTLFSRYYISHPFDKVPSLYVDLQLPSFDPTVETQPSLRLRLPNYTEDKEGLSKISRQELIGPLNDNGQFKIGVHQLPYLYHFDMEKHHHSPSSCTLYEVRISASSLLWKRLDSAEASCHNFMPYFGRNPCFATGFTRLFCPIVENIVKDDILELSPYLPPSDRIEHLTIAVTGGRLVDMSVGNAQMRPAEQVKILLLQGHLVVTDINLNLHIRVEYGWDCTDFSLAVPEGFSATRYRRFNSEMFNSHEGDHSIDLPDCFRLIPNSVEKLIPLTENISARSVAALDDESVIETNSTGQPILIDNSPEDPYWTVITEDSSSIMSKFWDVLRNNNTLAYAIIILIVLVILIPLCLGLFYRLYRNQHNKSHWALKHSSHENPAYHSSKDDRADISFLSYVDIATQTKDKPIRI